MSIELRTERLVLRPIAPEDCDAHIEMMGDPGVTATLTADGLPQSRADRWRQFASYLGHWRMLGFGWFSVMEKETGAWVGRVGPWMPEGWPGLECGWAIASPYWGRGYAPEAAVAAIRWTFDNHPDLERIISVIDPANSNSQAVARKIGEEKTGEVFDYAGFRLDVWAADRESWLSRFG